MPWKKNSILETRAQFVEAALRQKQSFRELCRQYGISPTTGYFWRARHAQKGREGLASRKCGRRMGQKGVRAQAWLEAFVALRRRRPFWGPKKLRCQMQRARRGARLPAVRTIGRWLREAGLVGRRKQRQRRGPALAWRGTVARRANAVWTVDFKGDFRTADRQRGRPLTIRDLYSRCVLCIRHVAAPSEAEVRKAMQPVFDRHGLPKVIRVDNGVPFSGVGPLQLSALSVWWLRLGIRVEFTRRAKPQDNGAHEQFHRVLKREIASPPAATLAAQCRRFPKFSRYYNEQRPHEALAQRRPAELYRASARKYVPPGPLSYRAGWTTRLVASKGEIRWEGRRRLVGRAFARQRVGLKVAGTGARGSWMKVYLGAQLIGELHRGDPAGMRGAHWKRAEK